MSHNNVTQSIFSIVIIFLKSSGGEENIVGPENQTSLFFILVGKNLESKHILTSGLEQSVQKGLWRAYGPWNRLKPEGQFLKFHPISLNFIGIQVSTSEVQNFTMVNVHCTRPINQ